MTEYFHDPERQRRHAQACADESGEAWCVCTLFGKLFCLPALPGLSKKHKAAGAQIIETCEPEVGS